MSKFGDVSFNVIRVGRHGCRHHKYWTVSVRRNGCGFSKKHRALRTAAHTLFVAGVAEAWLPTKLCSMVLFNGHFPPMPLSYSNPLHPTGWPVAKLRPTPRHVAPQRSKHCAMLRTSVVTLFVSASKAPAAQHTVAAIKVPSRLFAPLLDFIIGVPAQTKYS